MTSEAPATRSLIVNFVIPSSVSVMSPDNGVQSLTTALCRAGHQSTGLDFGALSTLEQFRPPDLLVGRQELVTRLWRQSWHDERHDRGDLDRFVAGEEALADHQRREVRRLGAALAQRVASSVLDFVGFKLWTGFGFQASVLIAEAIREVAPTVVMIGGGPHVDQYDRLVFRYTHVFDYLFRGECEGPIVQFADRLARHQPVDDVPNMLFLDRGKVRRTPRWHVRDLGALPVPGFGEEEVPGMHRDDQLWLPVLDDTRGCNNACNFCIHPRKSGRSRRTVGAERMVERLATLRRAYGFRAFFSSGSNPPVTYLANFARLLALRDDLRVNWVTFAHGRETEALDFGMLKRAGLSCVWFGLETGSQRILNDAINKRSEIGQIRRAVVRAKDAGIPVITSVIVPGPMDDRYTLAETLYLLRDLAPDSIWACYPELVVGTPWFEEPDRFGFSVTEDDLVRGQVKSPAPDTPISLWQHPQGYCLDGRTHREMAQEKLALWRKLAKFRLGRAIDDALFLLSDAMGEAPRKLIDQVTPAFGCGDYASLRRVVRRANRALRGEQ